MQKKLLTKKRREDFADIFAQCHVSMLTLEVNVMKIDEKIVDSYIKQAFYQEHSRFRKENKRMFKDQKSNGKPPNY